MKQYELIQFFVDTRATEKNMQLFLNSQMYNDIVSTCTFNNQLKLSGVYVYFKKINIFLMKQFNQCIPNTQNP